MHPGNKILEKSSNLSVKTLFIFLFSTKFKQKTTNFLGRHFLKERAETLP